MLKALFGPLKKNDIFQLSQTFNERGELIYFIDYANEAYEKRLEYRDLILNKINNNIDNPRVLSKYIWLLKHLHKLDGCDIPEELSGFIL